MMEISPEALVFRDVRLNNAYVNSICVTNPLPATVEFILKPSSQRYSVTPNRVTLGGGQSIVLTIRLFLAHYPNSLKGFRGQEDHIQVKSSYFEQKIPLTFFLYSKEVTPIARSRSHSPAAREQQQHYQGREEDSNEIFTPASASGRARSTGSSSKRDTSRSEDLIQKMNLIIRGKDERIQQLQETVGFLEAKYPNWQQIIHNRIEQERNSFEEKSEKVLRILRKKDEAILHLQQQLAAIREENRDLMAANSALKDQESASGGRSRDYWTGKSASDSATESEALRALRRKLEDESLAHEETQRQLASATTASRSAANVEAIGLREKVADQTEQIEVLLQEIASLRHERSFARSLSDAHEEISRLQREAKELYEKCSSYETKNIELQNRLEDCEKDENRVKETVFAVGTARGSTSTVQQKDRLAKAEDIIEELRIRLAEAYDSESSAKEKCAELDRRLVDSERHIRMLSEKLERSQGEREELEMKLAQNGSDLNGALKRLSAHVDHTAEQEAHVWWSYVWHEMRKRSNDKREDTETVVIDHQEATIRINKQRDTIHNMAVEIASLRQELLGKQLSNKKETDTLRTEVEETRREINRLQAYNRIHKSDRDIRLAEMAGTIRVLSARSDIHSQLVVARQEVESEKLSCSHLRLDLDAYRGMLETEQRANTTLKRQVDVLQAQLDSTTTFKTIVDVPGVQPDALIELFSVKLVNAQNDAARAKAEAAQLSASLKAAGAVKAFASSSRSQHHLTPADRKDEIFSEKATPLMVYVDREDSPESVMSSLDAVVLQHRVAEQEGTIIDLRERIAEMEKAMITTESGRLADMDDIEDRAKVELTTNTKRLELTLLALNEAKTEIADLRERNLELEKSLIENRIPLLSPLYAESTTGLAKRRAGFKDGNNDGGEFSSGETDGEEDYSNEGLEELRSVVRERTAQLKVLTQTIESLQLNASSVESSSLELIKRVVELSAELSAQTAAYGLAERKVLELEGDRTRKSKLCNTLKMQLQTSLKTVEEVQSQYTVLYGQLLETEKARREERMESKLENEQLSDSLKEAESHVQSLEITIEELRTQSKLSEEVDFQKWLENVILQDEKALLESLNKDSEQNWRSETTAMQTEQALPVSVSGPDSNDIRDLVFSLIEQWRCEHPHTAHFHRDSNSGSGLSKHEQKYLQRVSDLITNAYERCSQQAYKLRQAEAQRTKIEMSHSVLSNRLKTCVKHLHIYRKRAHASEAVTSADFKHNLRSQGKLIAILRKSLSEVRVKLYASTDALLAERRDKHLINIKGANALKKINVYEAKIAELETKGPFMLRAKEEALAALDERIKSTEDTCKKWFKVELPRLLSTTPVKFGIIDSETANFLDINYPAGEEGSTYALLQALCAAKAIQTALEVKMTSLEERHFVLKEKNITLRGTLMKWQNQVNAAFDNESLSSSLVNLQDETEKVYKNSAELQQLHEQIRNLSEIVVTLEEENVEARARCEHAVERSTELKRLLDSVVDEEQLLKSKATQQITRLRLELENNHVAELRELREAYEHEKSNLQEELSRLTAAFDDVNRAANVAVVNSGLSEKGGGAVYSPEKGFEQHRSLGDKVSYINESSSEMDKVTHLIRELESEARKNHDAQKEIEELGNIIAIQKQLLDERANRLHESIPPPPPHLPASIGGLTAIEKSVIHEDKEMWPSIMTIVEEQLEQLRILGSRNDAIRIDANLRAAIAMAFRIKSSLPVLEASAGSILSATGGGMSGHRSIGQNAGDLGSEDTIETSSSLHHLSQQVKRLETDLSEMKVPERHLSILRSLAGQVEILKQAMSHEADRRSLDWDNERAALLKEHEHYRQQIHELSVQHSSSAENVKKHYDAALNEAQDALEQQGLATRTHIEHLNEVIHQTQAYNTELKARVDVLEMQLRDQPPLENVLSLQQMVQSATEESEKRKQFVKELLDEHNREIIQLKDHFSVFRTTQEDIVQSLEKQIRDRDALSIKQDHFSESTERGRLADVQVLEDRIRQLEYQYQSKCKELEAALGRIGKPFSRGLLPPGSGSQGQGSFVRYDHEESVSSQAEDEAVGVEHVSKDSIRGIAAQSGLRRERARSDPNVLPPSALLELTSAKLSAAETEMISLHDALTVERQNTESMKSQVQQLQAQLDSKRHASARPAFIDDAPSEMSNLTGDQDSTGEALWTVAEKIDYSSIVARWVAKASPNSEVQGKTAILMKPLVAKFNELKRAAAGEISRLRQKMKDAVLAAKVDNAKISAALDESKEQISTLRDELDRKAKMLTSIKSSRSHDESILQQWQVEAKDLDAKLKQTRQTLKSKEALIKDLRTKLDSGKSEAPSVQPAMLVNTPTVSTSEVPIGNTGSMLADIKQKLKQSELEKGRMKKSMKTLTERNEELQQEVTTIKEEYEKARKVADRVHGLSASLTKKEAALAAAHRELESLQKTYEEAVLNSKNVQRELERDIRQLQRKVQIVEQQKELLDKELDLMRINRLSASDTLSLLPKNSTMNVASSSSQRIAGQPSSVALAAATAEVNRAEAAAAKLSRSRTQQESTSATGARAGGESDRELFFDNFVIPSTLDESAQDLNDIMTALGGKTLGMALKRGAATTAPSVFPEIQVASNTHEEQWMSPSREDSSSSADSGISENSIEQRLKALVSAALSTPGQTMRK